MKQHTPGPWFTKEDGRIVHDPTGNTIAACVWAHDENDYAANARLIATAPELFDFAIQVLYSLAAECAHHHSATPYSNQELADMARDVIARIENT